MIVDTDFLIDVMTNDKVAIDKLRQLEGNNETIAVATISIFELHSGIARSTLPAREKKKVEEVLASHEVFGLTSTSAQTAGKIDGDLIKAGKRIGAMDCLIAGIALENDQSVLTRNAKDFEKIPHLRVEIY